MSGWLSANRVPDFHRNTGIRRKDVFDAKKAKRLISYSKECSLLRHAALNPSPRSVRLDVGGSDAKLVPICEPQDSDFSSPPHRRSEEIQSPSTALASAGRVYAEAKALWQKGQILKEANHCGEMNRPMNASDLWLHPKDRSPTKTRCSFWMTHRSLVHRIECLGNNSAQWIASIFLREMKGLCAKINLYSPA